jgi:hypothetical protein
MRQTAMSIRSWLVLLGTGCELRVVRCGLRVASCGLRIVMDT